MPRCKLVYLLITTSISLVCDHVSQSTRGVRSATPQPRLLLAYSAYCSTISKFPYFFFWYSVCLIRLTIATIQSTQRNVDNKQLRFCPTTNATALITIVTVKIRPYIHTRSNQCVVLIKSLKWISASISIPTSIYISVCIIELNVFVARASFPLYTFRRNWMSTQRGGPPAMAWLPNGRFCMSPSGSL